MTDRFSNMAASIDGPATRAFAVAPSDEADLSEVTRGLYCGAGGDLNLVMSSGETVLFAAVSEGAIMPLRVKRVLATGTTAGSIVGLI